MEKEKNIFFVEVHEPDEVRRNTLESLKAILENLQRFEKFKGIRHDKIELMHRLDRTIKEINKLIPDLKKALPDAKIRAVAQHKHIGRKRASAKKEQEESVKEMPMSELQKLESELSEIEGKLSSLR